MDGRRFVNFVVSVLAVGDQGEVTKWVQFVMRNVIRFPQEPLPEVFCVRSLGVSLHRTWDLCGFQPLQQGPVTGLIEGAVQKKERPSLMANCSKASAMPSWVRPS